MIKVVSFKICPFVQRVTVLLAVKEVPYDVDYINLNNKPEWFLKISPNGQVPLLVTESGVVLFESDAIVEYLDEVVAPIEQGVPPEQRAIDRAWSYQAVKNYLVQCSTMQSGDKQTFVEREGRLSHVFLIAEAYLGIGPYFKGQPLSNVDIAWLPLLHRAAVIEKYSGYDFLANFPKVKLWQQAILATGLATKSVASDFEAAFIAFYLSDKTYLGACFKDKG